MSDLHLRADDDAAAATAGRVMEKVAASGLEGGLVVATGDLADDGRVESYETLRSIMDRDGRPWLLCLGNHDDRRAFRQEFPGHVDKAGFVQGTRVVGEVTVVALDTLDAGQAGGRLCDWRLAWLEAALAVAGTPHVAIAMHHPPVAVNLAALDIIGLQKPEPFWKVVEAHPGVGLVLCGHIHRATASRRGAVLVSTARGHAAHFPTEAGGDPGAARPAVAGWSWVAWDGAACSVHHETVV